MISPRQYRGLSRLTREQIQIQPTIEPVSYDDYLGYKRMKTTEDPDIVEDKLITAREACEKYIQRAFVVQTWNAFLELPPGTFPYFGMTASIFARYFGYQPEGIEIPYPPMISVNGAFITDETGTETLIDPSIYWTSRYAEPGRIAQKIDATWPDTLGRAFETFRLNFTCGYLIPFTATIGIADLAAPGHNYSVNDVLQITNREGILPAGLAQRTNYYVVASTPGVSVQLSTTLGGGAIIPTSIGTAFQFLGVMPSAFRRAILETAADDRYNNPRGAEEKQSFRAALTDDDNLPLRAKAYLNRYRLINFGSGSV